MKKLKILVSAYACEPNKGSEPDVGWNWATQLAKKAEIHVITKENNKENIETFLKNNSNCDFANNIHFHYIGLDKRLTFWKKGNKGIRLYYYLWQKKAYKYAVKIASEIQFDYVHCITFVSLTQPNFLYKLGLPIVWHIAGGERIPDSLVLHKTIKETISDYARDASIKLALLSLWNRGMLKASRIILATTEETKGVIPRKYRDKVVVYQSIGISKEKYIIDESIEKLSKTNGCFNILMVGRFLHWKAFEIGLDAFSRFQVQYPNSTLTLLGKGPRKENILKSIDEKGIKNVKIVKSVPHDEMNIFYQQYDLFLNTSLRDSGCMVILEARCCGLPAVCLSAGGPGILCKDDYSKAVPVSDYENTVKLLDAALSEYKNNSDLLKRDSVEGRNEVIRYFDFNNKVNFFNKEIMKYGE